MENIPIQMKSFLKPSEAAARFHVPLRTIYTWCLLGQIDCINVNGRCLRVHSKSLSEFLGARESVGRRVEDGNP
jgi:predicted site-specific integrase-resolvase